MSVKNNKRNNNTNNDCENNVNNQKNKNKAKKKQVWRKVESKISTSDFSDCVCIKPSKPTSVNVNTDLQNHVVFQKRQIQETNDIVHHVVERNNFYGICTVATTRNKENVQIRFNTVINMINEENKNISTSQNDTTTDSSDSLFNKEVDDYKCIPDINHDDNDDNDFFVNVIDDMNSDMDQVHDVYRSNSEFSAEQSQVMESTAENNFEHHYYFNCSTNDKNLAMVYGAWLGLQFDCKSD